ncbi:MAG: adenosylcobinamide-GDP ribazoletransferase [Armatimonadota bacterium]|nr:adenosylcobinamide-GDP ribazoletransferase [Armatimonadota bacterium]
MKPGQGWLWAPIIAVQFLTRIPILFVPDDAFDLPADGRRHALVFFPVVGLLVGGIGALVWLTATKLSLPPLAAAVLAVTATAMTTGAFHEDGLADTSDALGPHSREKALEVMRDSRIGTFGAVALWAVLTLKVTALAALPAHSFWPILLAAHVMARWSSLPLARWLPYAQEAKGLGAGLAALIDSRGLLAATGLMALCLLTLVGPHRSLLLLLGALAVILLTGLFYRRRFGGVTGDCLGATNQLIETLTLLIAAHPHF